MFLKNLWYAAWWGDDANDHQLMVAGLRHVCTTADKPMIDTQQQRLGDADPFDRTPVLLASDAASTLARRVYAQLLAAEQTAIPAHQG